MTVKVVGDIKMILQATNNNFKEGSSEVGGAVEEDDNLDHGESQTKYS